MFFAHSIPSSVKIKALKFYCFLSNINQDRAKFDFYFPVKAYFPNKQRPFLKMTQKLNLYFVLPRSFYSPPLRFFLNTMPSKSSGIADSANLFQRILYGYSEKKMQNFDRSRRIRQKHPIIFGECARSL
jgi:hypothetical protein